MAKQDSDILNYKEILDMLPPAADCLLFGQEKDEAKSILKLLNCDLSSKKFLNLSFNSQITQESNAFLSKEYKNWNKNDVFDVVLIYDFLDYQKNINSLLNKLKQSVHKNTFIYVRCFPWCSRLGCKDSRDINKAFLHLVLNYNDLKKLNINLDFNHKITYPLITYSDWFFLAGFNIVDRFVAFQEIEPIFIENELISKKMMYSLKCITYEHSCKVLYIDFLLNLNSSAKKVFI